MTDPAQPTATPAPSAQAPTKQDPLAVLEKLLEESKGTTSAADKAAAEQAAAEAQQAQIAQLEASHQAQDQQDLQTKIAELATIKNTPEYQARVQQDTAQAQTQAQKADANQGFEIKQLGHTKI